MNKTLKNVLSVLAVAFFGFIMLNLAFLLAALFQGFLDLIIGLFVKQDINMDPSFFWIPLLKHFLFLVLIAVISLFIFKSRLGNLYKAIYMTVPLAVMFATIGIFFYQWLIIVYVLGSLFFLFVLFYLIRTKQPWIYYYTLILMGITMLLVMVLGVEI